MFTTIIYNKFRRETIPDTSQPRRTHQQTTNTTKNIEKINTNFLMQNAELNNYIASRMQSKTDVFAVAESKNGRPTQERCATCVATRSARS